MNFHVRSNWNEKKEGRENEIEKKSQRTSKGSGGINFPLIATLTF
jgi:hypothetical protein